MTDVASGIIDPMAHRRWVVGRRGELGRGLGPVLGGFLVCALLGGCGADSAELRDTGGPRDGPPVLVENTLELCTDGQDNDGDGKIDCADEDCGQLLVCQRQPDAAPLVPENTLEACTDGADNDRDGDTDCADTDCHAMVVCVDAGVRDAGSAEGVTDSGSRDAPQDAPVDAPQDAPVDAPQPDLPLTSCGTHCDCPQGSFCYKGTCVQDPKMAVYCCAKPGCPPGKLCMDLAGQKSTCAEDATYACQNACDCGPAHCCVSGKCVKDTNDPWLTGGTALPGLSCGVGTDPTYCCADLACHEGSAAYAGLGQLAFFKCFDPATRQSSDTCGGKSCFGTACNCSDGEVCVDTITKPTPPAGSTCHLTSGGSCMSGAAAEAIFGWATSALLPCCKSGCTPGTQCDAGWNRNGGKFAYQRVVATCGPCADGQHHSCGLCGNNKCDVGEYPATCPQDCSCGDGSCAPEEIGACEPDCGTCGDDKCDPGESNLSCPADCDECGDGWCAATEVGTCTQDCWGICRDATTYPEDHRVCGDGVPPECGGDLKSCGQCAIDCPNNGWAVAHRATASPWSSLTRVWGSSSTDVYAIGSNQMLHFNGAAWAKISGPGLAAYYDIWGSSASNVYVTGNDGTNPVLTLYNGQSWKTVALPAPQVSFAFDGFGYSRVSGTSATDVFVGGTLWISDPYLSYYFNWSTCDGACRSSVRSIPLGCALWHYDGNQWAHVSSYCFDELWGLSAGDRFAVDGQSLHYGAAAGILRAQSSSWVPLYTTPGLTSVWGSSSNAVFAGGEIVATFDGVAWKPMIDVSVRGISGTSATNVFAVGGGSDDNGPKIMHFDGTNWQRVAFVLDASESAVKCAGLNAAWSSPTGDVFAVGGAELILHCPGGQCAPGHATPVAPSGMKSIDAPPPASDAGPPAHAGICGNGICEFAESCDGRTTSRCTELCPADCPGSSTATKPYCCVEGSCVGDGCPVAGCP